MYIYEKLELLNSVVNKKNSVNVYLDSGPSQLYYYLLASMHVSVIT